MPSRSENNNRPAEYVSNTGDYKSYFISKWPNEAAGYLKNGVFYGYPNLSNDPQNSFQIDSSILLDQPDVILHSHCVPKDRHLDYDPHQPSYQDLQSQIATDVEWGICVTDGETCEDPLCWGNPDNRPPLLERQFIHGIQDCLALGQDWYYQTWGIRLPTLARDPHWSENHNYMEELYESWGFYDVTGQEMQYGDVLLFKVRSKVSNHIGIYIGNGQMITHWVNRLSEIQTIGRWKDYITKIVRYKDRPQ